MASIRFSTVIAVALVLLGATSGVAPAQSPDHRLLVVVNDQPITNFDVTQRMRLNQVLGYARGSEAQQRKEALEELIDDVIKSAHAKKMNIEPTDAQIDQSIEKMSKNMGTTAQGLAATLSGKGVSMTALRQYVKASIAFNWIASRQYNIKVDVDQAEIDRRLNAFSSDPQFKPVAVYEVQEISLPVEKMDEPMLSQLLYARAVEAQQIMQRYKGCDSAKAAAEGVFNVKISKMVQAPADQIPQDMKSALEKAGTGRLIGPMRGPGGIQMIGFCGRRTLEPPRPTREMVENLLRNEKYRRATQRVLRDLRRSAYIDYKDTTGAVATKQRQAAQQTPPEQAKVPQQPPQAQDKSELKQLIESLQRKIDSLQANN